MAGMDVQRGMAQVKGRLNLFSGPQKIIIALLALVGIIAVGTFVRWVTAPSYDVLLSGLEPTDASAVTAQLDGSGVPYQLEAGGTTILIPSEQLQAQRLAVAAAGLPEGTTKGYAAMDEAGLTSSSFQQRISYQRAIEGELSKTLEQMADVRTATVRLALPEKELFTDKEKPARASVLLDTKGTLSRETVDSVQRLVAASVPDLEPSGVTVSDTKGRLLSDAEGNSGRQEAEQTLEDTKAAQADSMLASILGPGRAVVRVDADINTSTKSTESETYDPTKSVVLRENGAKEQYDANGTAIGGVVSVPDPGAVGDGGNTASKYNKTETSKENGVTRNVQKESTGPGALKRMTVSVVVDDKAAGLPTDKVLSDLVAGAVGLNTARGDTISVATMAFTPAQAPAEPTEPRNWADTATVGIAVLLLLVVALAFWRAARRTTTDLIELPTIVPEPLALVPNPNLAIEAARKAELQSDIKIMELVDSRPDEVSALIRGWLTDPADLAKAKVKK